MGLLLLFVVTVGLALFGMYRFKADSIREAVDEEARVQALEEGIVHRDCPACGRVQRGHGEGSRVYWVRCECDGG